MCPDDVHQHAASSVLQTVQRRPQMRNHCLCTQAPDDERTVAAGVQSCIWAVERVGGQDEASGGRLATRENACMPENLMDHTPSLLASVPLSPLGLRDLVMCGSYLAASPEREKVKKIVGVCDAKVLGPRRLAWTKA